MTLMADHATFEDRMSVEDHETTAQRDPESGRLALALITVSDSRTPETDRGGDLLERLATGAGHQVVQRSIVSDDRDRIDAMITGCLEDSTIRAILLTGGTGISPRDGTIEVVQGHLRVEIPGYGELIRRLGVDQVGPAAILGRAVGGVVDRPLSSGGPVLIFTMPGSVQAVESAMSGVVIPILPHAAWQVRKDLPDRPESTG